MRILGIDCGAGITGYGVVDSDGRAHRMLASGVIRTNPRQPMEQRLLAIGGGLRQVIARTAPDCAAVEDLFHAVNAQSALKLAQVRGAVLLILAEAGLAVAGYSPLEVKQSVVGYGRAGKDQVQSMVRSLVGAVAPFETPDASDAVAVAICHATRSPAILPGVRKGMETP